MKTIQKRIIPILLAFLLFTSTSLYLNAAGFVSNRHYSDFNSASLYDSASELMHRSNCYGYAFRYFFHGDLYNFSDNDGTGDPFYKQQPGEFAIKTNGLALTSYGGAYTYDTLYNNTDVLTALHDLFIYDETSSITDSQRLTFLGQLITADAATLGNQVISYSGSFPPNDSNGVRYVAMVAKGPTSSSPFGDFHFYIRHDDGTWSHKRGASEPQKTCLDHGQVLTDSNIKRHVVEGNYSGGLSAFYKITKDADTDMSHDDGHTTIATRTTTSVRDYAGDYHCAAKVLGNTPINVTQAQFDYPGDVDYFAFTAASTKTYTFTVTYKTSPTMYVKLYNATGTLLRSFSTTTGICTFTHSLQSGIDYVVSVSAPSGTTVSLTNTYTLTIS